MESYCPIRFFIVVVAASLGLACGTIDGEPSPTATPTQAQDLGLEIAEAYGELMQDALTLVEPRPPAPFAAEALRLLREEYKVRFGNYACLRDTLAAETQAEVIETFDAHREAFLPAGMAWFEDAASDYDLEDPIIRERLEDLETLDDYAFLERVAQSRPGEELLCGA